MIGGEERVQPFYPPETIALTLADIIQKHAHYNEKCDITVCLYRAAADAFNQAGEAYLPESQQIIHIKQCLRKLDISEEEIDAIVFICSDNDSETQKILNSFLTAKIDDPVAKKLENLYNSHPSFHDFVDGAVLDKFRSEPQAYKYVLFELAMILQRKPTIKAGDIREKKYDEIVRKFRAEIWWDWIENEKWESQPFQTLYWNRDNTLEKFREYISHKEQYWLSQKKKKIRTIQATVAASVLAFLSMSGLGYWTGKTRWMRDARYGAISAMDSQNSSLYDLYTIELMKINPPQASNHDLSNLNSHNLLLLGGANWDDSTGRVVPGIEEIMRENRHRISEEISNTLIAKMKLLNLPVDETRWQIYESMVREITHTFLERRIFHTREECEKTIRSSDILRAAENFLIQPLIAPTTFRAVNYTAGFGEWLSAWYRLQAEELIRDEQNGLEYLVYSDSHSGMSYAGPDSLIPIRREVLLAVCESFFPRWDLSRNYDLATVRRIQALYKLLLPILEKQQWEHFEYYGKALKCLAGDPAVSEILRLQGLDPLYLTSPDILQYFRETRLWSGIFSRESPLVNIESEPNGSDNNTSEKWSKRREFLISTGGKTPGKYAEKLESMARQYLAK